MDQNIKKLKGDAKRIFLDLARFYKESCDTQQDTYMTGKKEAFEEVLNWLSINHNGEFRFINSNAFLSMMQDKISKSKGALLSSGAEIVEEERNPKPLNFGAVRIQESRKRVNKYVHEYSNTNAFDTGDCVMENEEKPTTTPFKFNTSNINSNILENNNTNIFQNNNFSLLNGGSLSSSNDDNCNNNVGNNLSGNIFFPIKKEKK